MEKKLTKEQKLKKKIKELKLKVGDWERGVTVRVEDMQAIRKLKERVSSGEQQIEELLKSRDNEIYLRGRIEGMREVLGYREGTIEGGNRDVYYGEDEYDKNFYN